MNKRQKDILTVVVALLVVGGFLFLAEGNRKDKNDNSRLAAINNATTTSFVETTTSTTFPTVSTQPAIIFSTTTTTARATTATTAKKPTVTTAKKPTTATTKVTTKPAVTTTTIPAPHPGPGNEVTDNQASFVHNSDGSFSTSATNPPAGADPFSFVIKTEGAASQPGENASVKFSVTIKNNTAKPITFPGGLKVIVTVHRSGASDVQFTMDATSVTGLTAGEGVTVSSTTNVLGFGTFTAEAVCTVDYGS